MSHHDRNASCISRPFNKHISALFSVIRVLIEAIAIAAIVRSLFFQPFLIPSGSMKPTLLVGDYMLVSKYSYGYSKYSLPFGKYLTFLPEGRVFKSTPKRGDVVVFKLPSDQSTDYVKRVIGLPGDNIQVIDNVLYVNGKAVTEKLLSVETPSEAEEYGRVSRIMETLPNGVAHIIYKENGSGYWRNTGIYHVPDGMYFMMGDNRNNSSDSRDPMGVGYVPYDNIIGKAQFVFFSSNRSIPLWDVPEWIHKFRFKRFFNRIQ